MAKGNYTRIVYQYESGSLIKTYNTTSELTLAGFNRRAVYRCINGSRLTYKGFTWTSEIVRPSQQPERPKKPRGLGVKFRSEYVAWRSMKGRCYNPNNKGYALYGGRGIKVCDRWLNSFSNFLEDMGVKPTVVHSLDRYPNKDGNYEPSNCRWATPKEQSRNLRWNVVLTANGVTKILSEWAEDLGCKNVTISSRIKKGWSVEDAVLKPLTKKPAPANEKKEEIMQMYNNKIAIKDIAKKLNKSYFTVYEIIRRYNGK